MTVGGFRYERGECDETENRHVTFYWQVSNILALIFVQSLNFKSEGVSFIDIR